MCLYPKLIRNRKYVANKKNGGNIPAVNDKRVLLVPVGCGKCIECMKQKARQWNVRLQEEIKDNHTGIFITLTFSNESIQKLTACNNLKNKQGYDLDNAIATQAVRYFLERWRKHFKKSLRHWLVTELGHNGTENIHLHGIIWTGATLQLISKLWQYGYIWPREESKIKTYVNGSTITYITKYLSKLDEKHKLYKPIVLTSPGIGSSYINHHTSRRNKFNSTTTIESYKTSTGHEINLPIYYRNKLYNENQREQLWLQKLDKNERWICGEKIKADNINTINKTLKWYRKINTQLGYGNDEQNWQQKEYENQQRILMYEKRMAQIKKQWNKEIQ